MTKNELFGLKIKVVTKRLNNIVTENKILFMISLFFWWYCCRYTDNLQWSINLFWDIDILGLCVVYSFLTKTEITP